MNYYIAMINKDGEDWCIMESTDYDYISQVYEELSLPCNSELRATEESIDIHLNYEVLRYDHSFS